MSEKHESRISNYEVVKETWRQNFLAMDQEELIRRFSLKHDENTLTIRYFSHDLLIDRRTGRISYAEEGMPSPSFNTVITIYNLFHYSQENPKASKNLVPFREVKRVYPFEANYRRTTLKKICDNFSGHTEELKNACISLGGTPLSSGDVGYLLPVFPFLTIAILFWDGDDEFPANANLLFDSNITDFVHEENVVGIADDCLYYLTLASGICPDLVYDI